MPRPSVTLHVTQTLDGRMATVDGVSQWIGGEESLRFAHMLRAAHAAIMVGVGTVLRDNPRLTVRLVPGNNPLRIVVDSTLRTPPAAAVLAHGAAAHTLIATTQRAPAERRAVVTALGATLLVLPEATSGGVALAPLLDALGERGVTSVMVEGGPTLVTALLRERLANRLALCVAPCILGTGLPTVGELGIRDLAAMITLTEVTIQRLGADTLFDGKLVYAS